MTYDILKHSADEKFRAKAPTLSEVFKEATKAFSEIVGGGTGQYKHDVKVESENLEALLYDFLDELIFLQDSRGVVISHAQELTVEDLKDQGWRIEAEILVDTVKPGQEPMHVKSPTYNEMKVDHQQGEGWILEAVLDV